MMIITMILIIALTSLGSSHHVPDTQVKSSGTLWNRCYCYAIFPIKRLKFKDIDLPMVTQLIGGKNGNALQQSDTYSLHLGYKWNIEKH